MSDENKVAVQSTGYSAMYEAVRREVQQWPAWKGAVYNSIYATSAHARKIDKEAAPIVSHSRPLKSMSHSRHR